MAAKSKSADRATVVGKLVKLLKKEFGPAPKRETLPVLETIIYAICLENSHPDEAMAGFQRLKSSFIDWNEIRVSTISELEPVFIGLPQPEWKAMRVRYFLFYIFDHQYSYDFDALKKKTLELAQKQLQKIKHLTPFVRNYLFQTTLGNHVIPMDRQMVRAAQWLGLLPDGCDEDVAADALKGVIRKSDGPEFFWLLKSLSVCSKLAPVLKDMTVPSDEADALLESAESRLTDVLAGRKPKQVAPEAKKPDKAAKPEKPKASEKAPSPKKSEPTAKPDSKPAPASPKTAGTTSKKAAAVSPKPTPKAPSKSAAKPAPESAKKTADKGKPAPAAKKSTKKS